VAGDANQYDDLWPYLGMNNNYSKNKNNEFELSVRMPRIDSY